VWKTTNIQKFGAAAGGSNVIMGNMEDDWSSALVCGSNFVRTFLGTGNGNWPEWAACWTNEGGLGYNYLHHIVPLER
jgi:hypothetical protein